MNTLLVFQNSPWLIFPAITLAFALAYFLYYKETKLDNSGKKIKILLTTLRTIYIMLMLIMLIGIFIKSYTKNIKKPVIIFLQDNSESVKKFVDKNYIADFKEFEANISKKISLKKFSFGNNYSPDINFEMNDTETDIQKPVSELADIFFNENVGAMIIATDGIYNKGKNPENIPENINYPIYTIALGDTTIKKDIAVTNVNFNEIVFLNNNFFIETYVNASKLKNKKSEIIVYQKNKKVFSQIINFDSDNYLKKILIELKAETAGIIPLNIIVKAVDGESNIKNNSRQIIIEVKENKQKILLLADAPHPDISALRNSLGINLNFETEFYLISDFNKNINEYNLIILHQIPSITNAATDILLKITDSQIPSLYILGMQSDIAKFNTLKTGLAIQKGSGTFDEINGFSNPDFDIFTLNQNITKLAEQAPPLISPFGNYSAADFSQIFLYSTIRTLKTKRPLWIFNTKPSSQKIAVIAGEGLWRWRMFDYKINNNHFTFDEIINKTAQYLIVKEIKERFNVKVQKIVNPETEIIFDAQIYNKSFELINNQDVNLIISDSAQNKLNYIFEKTDKAYTLNVGKLKSGEYLWTANTIIDGKPSTKNGIIRITQTNIEDRNTIADHNLCNQISTKTEGKMFSKNQFKELEKQILQNKNIVPISYSQKNLINIADLKIFFFLILILMSAEWLIRKLNGLT